MRHIGLPISKNRNNTWTQQIVPVNLLKQNNVFETSPDDKEQSPAICIKVYAELVKSGKIRVVESPPHEDMSNGARMDALEEGARP